MDFTKSVVDELQKKVPDMLNNQDLKSVLSTARSAITSNPMAGQGNSSHLGTIVLNFVDYEDRQGETLDVIEYMRSNFSEGTAGAEITVEKQQMGDRKSTRLNSSHVSISYAVFCLKKKTIMSKKFINL